MTLLPPQSTGRRKILPKRLKCNRNPFIWLYELSKNDPSNGILINSRHDYCRKVKLPCVSDNRNGQIGDKVLGVKTGERKMEVKHTLKSKTREMSKVSSASCENLPDRSEDKVQECRIQGSISFQNQNASNAIKYRDFGIRLNTTSNINSSLLKCQDKSTKQGVKQSNRHNIVTPVDPSLLTSTEIPSVSLSATFVESTEDTQLSTNLSKKRNSSASVEGKLEKVPSQIRPVIEIESTPRKGHLSSSFATRELSIYNFPIRRLKSPQGEYGVRVPARKIIRTRKMPYDLLERLGFGEQSHTLGFVSNSPAESVMPECDRGMMYQVNLMQTCERLAAEEEAVEDEEETPNLQNLPAKWAPLGPIYDDPIERIWQWYGSLLTSRDVRGENAEDEKNAIIARSREIMKKTATNPYFLSPNEEDAKSIISNLQICSDASTELEWNEGDFISTHRCHSFTDPIKVANNRLQNRYTGKAVTTACSEEERSGSILSDLESLSEDVGLVNTKLESEEASTRTKKTVMIKRTNTSQKRSKTSLLQNRQRKGRLPNKEFKTGLNVRVRKSCLPKLFRRSKLCRSHDMSKTQEELDHDIESGSNYQIPCSKILAASQSPNPLRWMDVLETLAEDEDDQVSSLREFSEVSFSKFGLKKRFGTCVGGLQGLNALLERSAEPDQPKAELLMDCMVKQNVLGMQLVVKNSDKIKELYTQTIVRHPMLYKMLLRRRGILPYDLQVFVAKIMEATESTDGMLAVVRPSKERVNIVNSAAKEMFASGFLSGGPTCGSLDKCQVPTNTKPPGEQKKWPTGPDCKGEGENADVIRVFTYGNDNDLEKAFNCSLRMPCSSILEELASFLPDFAYYIRPLFEKKWETISSDETLLTYLPELQLLKEARMNSVKAKHPSHKDELAGNDINASRVNRLCKALVHRVCNYLQRNLVNVPGEPIWMALLACLNAIIIWPFIGECLLLKLDDWLPVLLNSLSSQYATIREEVCCVLSYFVSTYSLFCQAHLASRNLLAANITLSLLDGMLKFQESYSFYFATLAYMLHSIPCMSALDSLILWIPDQMTERACRIARDWPRVVSLIIKFWPTSCLKWDTMYKRKLQTLLEYAYKIKHSKYNARIALGSLGRRLGQQSSIWTFWPIILNEGM